MSSDMSSVPDPKVFVNYRCMLFEAILANNIHIYAVICSTKFLVKKQEKQRVAVGPENAQFISIRLPSLRSTRNV